MSHTRPMKDKAWGFGEPKAVDNTANDVPPSMADGWADFRVQDRRLVQPSRLARSGGETSGEFFLRDLKRDLKRHPKPVESLQMPLLPSSSSFPPPQLASDTGLVSSRWSVWTVLNLLGAMALLAVLVVLGTIWLTARAVPPKSATPAAAPSLAPGQRLGSRAMERAATTTSEETRRIQPRATPMVAPAAASVVVLPAPTKQGRATPAVKPTVKPTVKQERVSEQRRRRRSKRTRPSKDLDVDDQPAPTAPGYSLYATLGAARGKPTRRSGASASSESRGVVPETANSRRPPNAAGTTFRMLKIVAGTESRNPAASATLPARIPTSAVTRAVGRIQRSVQACLRRFGFGHATMRLRVTVSGTSGQVTAARALGRFKGSPAGGCALRRVRSLRFPRFSRSSQTILLPIRSQ